MVVVYTWKLNDGLIFDGLTSGDSIIEAMKAHEFPRAAVLSQDASRIKEVWPWEMLRDYGSEEEDLGDEAYRNREWGEAIDHYQHCAQALERFRESSVLEVAARCYLRSAHCALAAGRPALSLTFLRQHFLMEDASEYALDLQRVAKEYDAKFFHQTEEWLNSTNLKFEDVKFAVEYAIENPLSGRLSRAEQIVERFRARAGNEPELLWYLGRCYMSQGRWSDAHSLLAPLTPDNVVISAHLSRWQGLFSRGCGKWTPRFGAVPDDCDLDVSDAVNRGLTFLVSALYHDAREWLLFALEKSPQDPFALFGHALFLWRQGWIALAAERLKLAKDALEKYGDEFRLVQFARIDETCEARSYHFDPLYPIFNIGDCLERTRSREPFVSSAIAP